MRPHNTPMDGHFEFDATYEGGVLKPDQHLDLPEHARVRVVTSDVLARGTPEAVLRALRAGPVPAAADMDALEASMREARLPPRVGGALNRDAA